MGSGDLDGRRHLAEKNADVVTADEPVRDAAAIDEGAGFDEDPHRGLDLELRRKGKKSSLSFRTALAALLIVVIFSSLGAAARLALRLHGEEGLPPSPSAPKTPALEPVPKSDAAREQLAPALERVSVSGDAPQHLAVPVQPTDVAAPPAYIVAPPADVVAPPADVVAPPELPAEESVDESSEDGSFVSAEEEEDETKPDKPEEKKPAEKVAPAAAPVSEDRQDFKCSNICLKIGYGCVFDKWITCKT